MPVALLAVAAMAMLLGIAYAFSMQRGEIRFRTVGAALALQIGIGALALYVPAGRDVLESLSNGVSSVIAFGQSGIDFVFGSIGMQICCQIQHFI